MKNYLATTGISKIWDLDSRILLLGPWCLTDERNKRLLEGIDYTFVSSPWRPAFKLKEAGDYCHQVYERLLLQLSEELNSIHQVSYPVRYWRVLLGPWLLQFIAIFYDRFKRIEKALELFPDFYTYVLPREQCKLATCDMSDFLEGRVIKEDYYNLKLFSLVAYELCLQNTIEKDYISESKVFADRYGWRKKLFNRLIKLLNLFFKGPIVLSDMYHLSFADAFLLKWRVGFRTLQFKHSEPFKMNSLKGDYSLCLREKLKLKGTSGKFESLLYKTLADAIPTCYMENYKFYRNSIQGARSMGSVRIVGSAVGWYYNERFKFFSAEAKARGADLIDFQHGGGYGMILGLPQETLSLEKDIFYTWGWRIDSSSKTKPLPSPHLSRLREIYAPRIDSILFVGISMPRYHYSNQTELLPEDMPKYFEDKKIFFQSLPDQLKDKILYRLYTSDYGWGESGALKQICPGIKFVSRGKLAKWMKKVKLVVIDHPHTSFIEALTINVPSISYWDHEVYLIRPEAEEYFRQLREAGVIFKDPKSAAEKLKEIFNHPMKWWLSNDVQKARLEFCNRYAYARKDWLKIWAEELKQLQKHGVESK